MIKIPENATDRKRIFLEYWDNYLLDLKNMAGHAHNYKELFKVIDKLEIEIVKESTLRDLWGVNK